ncbi:MAG: phenylalanine--tRNA ligase subunit beta [Clostridia bacterium]|nr:phenylalanine--tRNA ligase subunit beta [Clostridia bacterium]
MIVSLEWLKDYVDVNVDPVTFCDRMIMSGSNLETLELVGQDIKKVVVGKIVEITKHPDADKLSVCQIEVGEESPIQIVTGAPNVFVGAYVPVCLDGSHIPGPLHGQPKVEGGVDLKASKLRGVLSNGMLASFSELGFSDKVIPVDQKDGIWILPEGLKVGEEVVSALGLEDAIIDFEITPNRPDCLSMIGMAREAAATFGESFRYPETVCKNEVEDVNDYVKVSVESENCKRYTARVVKDVKVAPSPWWLQKKLIHAGMRPINNIVDITNFVMLEYGQPLHAFDIESLAGHQIIVKEAKDGDTFVTLDGTERKLDSEMLMINDCEKAVAVAGVMGGLNSEITDSTSTIVVESANFFSNSVRMTSKRLTLRTEASGRYEKGIDPNLCQAAADRVCYLIELLGAGTVVKGTVDIYPKKETANRVHARVSRINHVLGISLDRETMVKYLTNLEMKVEGEGDDLYVTAPTVRQDMAIEEDVVEEVARIYGYDNLPVTIPKGNNEAGQSHDRDVKDLTRETLCGMGLNEIQTYSFVSPKGLDNIRIEEDSWERNFVKILNPLGDDTSVMRTVLTPQMLEVMARNFNRKLPAFAAFEIGNTFTANWLDEKGLPYESDNLSIGMYGKGVDFFTLKGVVAGLLSKLGIKDIVYVPETEYGVYHPGRCARIVATNVHTDFEGDEEIELGIMGEVHPEVTEKYDIDTKAYVCELFFENVIELSNTVKLYHQIPKHPAITRDIALLCDEEMTVREIEEAILGLKIDLIKDVKLFDIYRGAQVPENKKSMAFSITYRDDERTLTDDEVVKAHSAVLATLKDKLGLTLREM